MPRNLLLKSELSRWFATQRRFANRKELANAAGIPYETLKGHFKGKLPRPENALRLSEVTGLDVSGIVRAIRPMSSKKLRGHLKQLAFATRIVQDLHCEMARSLAGLIAARNALFHQMNDSKGGRTKSARAVQSLMDAIQISLKPFLDDPEGLSILRRTISGSDAGYLSGLLGAIFDDRRLQRWRDMTTYVYGSK